LSAIILKLQHNQLRAYHLYQKKDGLNGKKNTDIGFGTGEEAIRMFETKMDSRKMNGVLLE
jgi:hypothetical protein